MTKTIYTTVCFTLFFSSLFVLFKPVQIFAQEAGFNIATTLNISDPDAKDGDILSLTDQNETLTRSKVSYDERMYGIAIENPVVTYRTRETMPVMRSGDAFVNVTTLNGPIKVGDFVTSSEITGKGQKATQLQGYILGVALTTFAEKDGVAQTFNKKQVYAGRVKVTVGIGPASPVQIRASGGLFGTFKRIISNLLFNFQFSDKIIRYILAALVAILTIYISFKTFGKNVTQGIESIGRNPLAKVSIQTMIVVNVILIAVVCLGGVILSLAIISF